jgi:tRNA (cmo5U34)-methyltransferase
VSKFSFDTVTDFDNHISGSIFGYSVLHSLIINISSFFIKNGTTPVDLGCTSGKLLKAVRDVYGCDVIGYDITPAQFIEGLDLRVQDITSSDFIIPDTNIIYSVFTLQFIDYSKRLDVIKKAYKALYKNGAFIFCEKEICANGIIQEVFTFSNYQYKKSVFTSDEILAKEYDLRSIMNTLESKDNIELLKKAGFSTIEPFFQSLNFKGYLCKK